MFFVSLGVLWWVFFVVIVLGFLFVCFKETTVLILTCNRADVKSDSKKCHCSKPTEVWVADAKSLL